MRIPFGTPTVSDATMLGLINAADGFARAGERLYKLLYQLSYSSDTNDWAEWTEVDSGANVNKAAGVWSMNGSGAWNANGIYKTAGHALAEGYWEVKWLAPNFAEYDLSHINGAAALVYNYARHWALVGGGGATYFTLNRTGAAWNSFPRTGGTWYTLRFYMLKDQGGLFKRTKVTIQGGTEYPSETMLVDVVESTAMPDPFYPGLQRYTNSAGNLTQYKEYRWYTGLPTTGPTLTYVADAGAGRYFDDFVTTNLAPVGGFATTNLRFQYSFDDGVAAYNGVWLTLAQLNAVGTVAGERRYVRLMVQVNSDGSTQAYAGELNAADGVGMIDETARNTVTPAQVLDGEAYLHLGVPTLGTYECPGAETPICLGVVDAEPYCQGLIRVRFYEMVCLGTSVPYRYDFHIKPLLDGVLTKAEIDAGTYYSVSFYQDQINPYLYYGSPYGEPGIGIVALAIEAWGTSGNNVHPFSNQQYQIAVRAVAINGNVIAEDDNEEVVVSYSNGYQGTTSLDILDWPCLELCTPIDLSDVHITQMPDLTITEVEEPLVLKITDLPNLNVHLFRPPTGRK